MPVASNHPLAPLNKCRGACPQLQNGSACKRVMLPAAAHAPECIRGGVRLSSLISPPGLDGDLEISSRMMLDKTCHCCTIV